jgi:predicted MPP superfamily phosphohydrolase
VIDLIGSRLGQLQPDFDQAFAGIHPQYQTLLLSHQPSSIDLLSFYTPTLILSGHTHGGQIWPFGYLVRLQQPYLKGLHTLPNGVSLYVNSSIGFWGPPMRLGSQAEITYII